MNQRVQPLLAEHYAMILLTCYIVSNDCDSGQSPMSFLQKETMPLRFLVAD